MIPLPELLAVNQSSPLYNEGDRRSIFYAESWALTHYLLTERPNGGAEVNKYVTAVAGGVPADAAFTRCIRRNAGCYEPAPQPIRAAPRLQVEDCTC